VDAVSQEARRLNCDICGREITTQAFKVKVEGAKLLVCGRCQRLGTPYTEEPSARPPAVMRPFSPRIAPRKAPELPRGMAELEIVEDCADRVRRNRMKSGLSQEELAKRVKEKLSVIQKIETGKMSPDTKLCRALEHELKIKLLVPRKEVSDVPKTAPPGEVTLGDIIRIKGKLKPSAES
jgi:putative transcription factor